MKYAVIEINDFCPNNCLHCSSYSSPNGVTSIPPHDFFQIVDVLSSLKYKRIVLLGGEPLLNGHINNYITYMFNKGFEINIYTSGAIDVDNINLQCLKMTQKIVVSIYSMFSDKHDYITGNSGAYIKTINFINLLIKNNIPYELNVVLMRVNVNDIGEIINSQIGKSAVRINILKLVIQGNAIKNRLTIEPGKDEIKIIDKLGMDNRIKISHSFDFQKGFCDAGRDKICITADGYILPCEVFKENRKEYKKYQDVDLFSYLNEINYKHYLCAFALCQVNTGRGIKWN
jgi:MoaA/NifB/PqqE/SkfB family radical SAM enzyme